MYMKIAWRRPCLEETTFAEIAEHIKVSARSGGGWLSACEHSSGSGFACEEPWELLFKEMKKFISY